MKGLLLKDFYMMKKYCRSYFLIAVIFLVVSLLGNGNLFFIFYPCLLCGMIPVSLLAYDERSHFMQYSATLPYTKAQIVSSKYVLGLLVQAAVLVVTAVAQAVKMSLKGSFEIVDFLIMVLSLFVVSTLASSIALPFIFKLGVEKGRLAYYVMIGFVCAVSVIFSQMFKGSLQVSVPAGIIFGALAIVGAVLYVVSWLLSISFFKKREI